MEVENESARESKLKKNGKKNLRKKIGRILRISKESNYSSKKTGFMSETKSRLKIKLSFPGKQAMAMQVREGMAKLFTNLNMDRSQSVIVAASCK